jgi:hypothetical protein
MPQTVAAAKRLSVDLVGTYRLDEPITKQPPKSEQSYEVPRGEYPVMGLLSADGKRVEGAGIVFSAIDPRTEQRVDIVEKLRPVEIPELVHRRRITLALDDQAPQRVKFPLPMFLGEPQTKKHDVAPSHEQAQEHSRKRGLSI